MENADKESQDHVDGLSVVNDALTSNSRVQKAPDSDTLVRHSASESITEPAISSGSDLSSPSLLVGTTAWPVTPSTAVKRSGIPL